MDEGKKCKIQVNEGTKEKQRGFNICLFTFPLHITAYALKI